MYAFNYILFFCVLFCLTLKHVLCSEVKMTSILRYNGYKILSDSVTANFVAPSKIVCFAECASRGDCWSASWNSVDRTCLFTHHLFVARRDLISEVSSNWIMAAMMRYDVFVVDGPGGGYTIETLADAENVCLSVQAVIADPEDLLAARAIGLHACNCAWLSDGNAGFVLQEANWACFGEFHNGILSCIGHFGAFNAWCKLPL